MSIVAVIMSSSMGTQLRSDGETSRLEGELWAVGRNSMLAKVLPYWGRSATTEIAGSRSYQRTWWNSVGVVSSLSSAIPRSPCDESNRTFTSTFKYYVSSHHSMLLPAGRISMLVQTFTTHAQYKRLSHVCPAVLVQYCNFN